MLNAIFVVCIGGVMGLLINYLSDVLPYTRKFTVPVCQKCDHPFKLFEALFSFRCSNCQSRPSLRHFLVIIFAIVASIYAAIDPIKGLDYWMITVLLTFLGTVMVIDIEHRAVLNEMSIIGAILLLIFGLLTNGLWKTILGGVAGYGFMLLIYYGGALFSRIISKIRHQEIDEVALGFGDVNVTGFLGLIIGWPDVISMLVLAILLGGIFSLLMILILGLIRKYKAFTAIPYAPFLIISALAILFIR